MSNSSAKGKTLVIVESPAKAKTIEKYLGADYIVRASVGHVRDLPKSNKKAIDIEAGFVPHYEVSPDKKKILSELKSLTKEAKAVFLATDPDREGEAIAWHLADELGLKDAKRIKFHEITNTAVNEAASHPQSIDMNLKVAQEARRVLDRLVGYDLSGLIWKKVRYGLSAGRVQSPALRIIMEREREIRAFIPETFWRLSADVATTKKIPLTLDCSEEPRDKDRMEFIRKEGEAAKIWTVRDIKTSEASRSPKAPFTTSTLQQTASTRLGYSPSRTMQIAQKLYEVGLITYMRTDSTNLSKEAQHGIFSTIESLWGKDYLHPRTFKSKSKNAQEAHEAVRPTDMHKKTGGTTPEQQKLYRLIWQRTVASQMADARVLRTKISAGVGVKDFPDFAVNGAIMLFKGWLMADPDAEGEEVTLPELKVGDELSLKQLNVEEKQTEPPGRYTEAGLVKELEKRDIGRPSTYAAIIKTIVDRGYVEKENKSLKPTDTGDVVSSFLEEHFAKYISDTFTAEMEQELDDLADGSRKYVPVMTEFYTAFHEAVKAKDKIPKVTNLGDADENIHCPKCDGPMIIKLSKSGKFLSCANFPTCDGARTEAGEVIEGPKPTGEKCPKCEKGDLVERSGRFGKFIACSTYPKCKYIKNDPTLNPVKSSGVKCDVCGKGEMIERKGRFGFFWSCSNYPDCKHAIKTKPTGNKCPICGALMMTGTKTIPERCSVKTCPMHNPHKLNKEKAAE
ncbi:MAG TPA: type I DNA topoisomerase [Candidatus Paceibacterota bacterium]|nr:type I DNA topoisomerase [Candidatus Paceibacterota bacterium]